MGARRGEVRKWWAESRVSVFRGVVEQVYESVEWGVRVREGISESK